MNIVNETIIVNGQSIKTYFLKQDWFMLVIPSVYIGLFTFVLENNQPLPFVYIMIVLMFASQQLLTPLLIPSAFLDKSSLRRLRYYNATQKTIYMYLMDMYLVKSKKIVLVLVSTILMIAYAYFAEVSILRHLAILYAALSLGILFYVLGLFNSLRNGYPSKLSRGIMLVSNLLLFIGVASLIRPYTYVVFLVVLLSLLLTSYLVYKNLERKEVVDL